MKSYGLFLKPSQSLIYAVHQMRLIVRYSDFLHEESQLKTLLTEVFSAPAKHFWSRSIYRGSLQSITFQT
jgi:hypothetical protein